MNIIKLYTTHCPMCETIQGLLDKKRVKYELIEDKNIIMDRAQENRFTSVPFAKIDDKFLSSIELREYINNIK